MIASLTGVVSEKLIDRVTIDVGGVGYGVFVTSGDLDALNVEQTAKLFIYEYVREQAHDLFGFTTKDNQKLFERLLDVNGVGPKMALSLLSLGSSKDLVKAITAGDVGYLQATPGVGRRLAERVIVDLKDKLGAAGEGILSELMQHKTGVHDEATQALVALGYTSHDAVRALSSVDTSFSVEERVKQALKNGLT